MSSSSKTHGRRSGSDPPSDDDGTHQQHQPLTRTDTRTSSEGQQTHSARTGSFGRLFGSFGSSEGRRADSQPLSSPPPLSADGSFGAYSEPGASTRSTTPFRSRASSAIASKTPFGRPGSHHRSLSIPTAVTTKPTTSVSGSVGSCASAARTSVELDSAQERYPFALPSPAVTSPSTHSDLSPHSPAGLLSLSDLDEFFENTSEQESAVSAHSPHDQESATSIPGLLVDSTAEVGDVSGRVLSKATDFVPYFKSKNEKKRSAREGYSRPLRPDVLEKEETNKLNKFWNLSESQAQQQRERDAEERERSISDFLNSGRSPTSPPGTDFRPGFHPRLSSISEGSREVIGALPRFQMDSSLLTPGSGLGADAKDKQKRVQEAKEMFEAVSRKAERTGTPMPPYDFLELIGKGSFGLVYKARDKSNGNLVAIKIAAVDDEFGFEETVKDFQKEVSILQQLKSNNIKNVNLIHDAFDLHSQLWIVADYCTGGSLRTLLRAWEVRGKAHGLPEHFIVPIAREVAVALKGLHDMHIIHRDIKSANIYITETGEIQVGDFGIVGVIDDGNSKRKTVIGTPQYMSAELMEKLEKDEKLEKGYGTEVDIWAFGCTIYEMATGAAPYSRAKRVPDILQVALAEGPPRLEGAEYSAELCDLVAYCTPMDPKARPTADAILKHPFVANTSKQYPTSNLVKLIEKYKIWENGGGSRASLWLAAPSDAAKPTSDDDDETNKEKDDDDNEGWNFSTSEEFDKRISQMPAYQQGDLGYLQAPEGAGLPPGLPQINTKDLSVAERIKREHSELSANRGERSLARVFNTGDEAGYQLSSPPTESTPPPTLAPPPSDLPLRNFTGNAPTRESMIEIDLDEAGVNETATSTFALHMNAMNDNTIKPAPRKPGFDDDEDEDFQFSEQEDTGTKRDTMAWTFPSNEAPQPKRGTMDWSFSTAEPTPDEPEYSMDLPSFGGGGDLPPGFRPGLKHTATEPIGHFRDFSHDMGSAGASPARQSVTSMIDLDMGLADPPRHLDDPADIVRPSTASSNTGSTMTDMTSGNPFDLEEDPIQNEIDRDRFSYHKQWQSETLRKRESRKAMETHTRGISLSSTGSGIENQEMTSPAPNLGELMPPSEVFESDMLPQQNNNNISASNPWPNFTRFDSFDGGNSNFLPTFASMNESYNNDANLRANGLSSRSREPSAEPPGPEVDFPDIVAPDPNALQEDADPRLLEDELGHTLTDLTTALSGMEAALRQYTNVDDNDVDDEHPSDTESGFESSKDTATEDEGTPETFLTARRNIPRSRSPGGD